MEVEVPKILFLRSNKCIDMVQWVLRWERQERWYGRKRQRPMPEKCFYNRFWMNIFWGLHIQLFPLCALIISQLMRHTNSNFALPYPLNRHPHVSPNNVGHIELKNQVQICFFGLPTKMFGIGGVYYNVGKVFPIVCYMTQKIKNSSCKMKMKKICNC